MRIFLTISLLASLLVAIPAARADACSCALLSTQEMLDAHDAAFVGTLVERGTTVSQDPVAGQTVGFTFEVEHWLKGDLGPTIEVSSATDGAACGFEIPIGERAAIFLNRQGDTWTSGLCSTMPADVVLAAMEPLVTGSTDPPFALLYGGTGPQRLMLIDAQGDVISLPPDGREGEGESDWVSSVSACPDGGRIIEAGGPSVRFRTLPDLSIEHEINLEADYVSKAWCRSGASSQFLALVGVSRPDGEVARLVDQDGKIFFDGRGWVAEVIGSTAFVAANEGQVLVAIDLTTNDSGVVYQIEVPDGGSGAIEAMVSDGTRLAFIAAGYGPDGESHRLVVVDAATRQVVAERPVDAASVRWAVADRLLLTSFDEDREHHEILDADSLESLGDFPGTGAAVVLAGEMGVAVNQGTLLAVTPDEVRQMRTYPNAGLWNIEVIDPAVSPDIPADAPILEPTEPEATTVPEGTLPPEAGPLVDPVPDEGATAPWALLIVAGGLVAAGLAVWRMRSRRAETSDG